MTQTKAKPRRVDFQAHPDDLKAVELAHRLFSTACISRVTGLTPSQVMYRLGKAGAKRLDGRNGSTKIARLLLNGCSVETLAEAVERDLRERRLI